MVQRWRNICARRDTKDCAAAMQTTNAFILPAIWCVYYADAGQTCGWASIILPRQFTFSRPLAKIRNLIFMPSLAQQFCFGPSWHSLLTLYTNWIFVTILRNLKFQILLLISGTNRYHIQWVRMATDTARMLLLKTEIWVQPWANSAQLVDLLAQPIWMYCSVRPASFPALDMFDADTELDGLLRYCLNAAMMVGAQQDHPVCRKSLLLL